MNPLGIFMSDRTEVATKKYRRFGRCCADRERNDGKRRRIDETGAEVSEDKNGVLHALHWRPRVCSAETRSVSLAAEERFVVTIGYWRRRTR